MIKAIIFDFGQTLVDSAGGFKAAEKWAQSEMIPDFRALPHDEFLATYRKVRSDFHNRSVFSRKAIWLEVYKQAGQTPDLHALEKREDEYWERVKANSRLFPEAADVLAGLARDFSLALITNTQGQKASGTHRLSQFPELEHFFKVIVVAGEGGIPAKPDPMPFARCLEQLGIQPHEAVYVGDDWRIDVCGSRDFGMHPVWLRHQLVKRNWPDVKDHSVPAITSLEALLDLENILA